MTQLLRKLTAGIAAFNLSSDSYQVSSQQSIVDVLRLIRLDYLQASFASGPTDKELLESQDTVSSSGRLRSSLLFLPPTEPLRQRLLSKYYPWLSTTPLVRSQRNLAANCCLHILRHDDRVRGCHFSPDGRLVASASKDGCVRLWNVETGKMQRVMGSMSDSVCSVTMSQTGPRGHAIPAAHTAGSIMLWDAATGVPLRFLSPLAETSDNDEGNTGNDKDDMALGEATSSRELPNVGDPVVIHAIALAPKGDRLAAFVNNRARLWGLENGFGEIGLELAGSTNPKEPGSPVCVRFSPDGKYAAFE